jgi:ABC-type multidrug transport system ATPase subunit
MGVSPLVVRVQGFGKRYGKRVAAEDIDLTVSQGELVGPDGSGETSLIKAIAGVLFDTGTVEVFGVSLTSKAAAERIKDRVGFMPQGLGLNRYRTLSVEENIDFVAEVRLVSKQRFHSARAIPQTADETSLGRHEAETRSHLYVDP